MNVRLDMLRRFRAGEVATLICTDSTLDNAERLQMSLDTHEVEDGATPQRKKHRSEKNTAGESSGAALHRGVDFYKVQNVLIFDGLESTTAINLSKYTHRVGRTGRAGQPGTSILFLTVPQAGKVLRDLRGYAKGKGTHIRPLKPLDRSEATKLQYRVDSVLANVTRTATRRLRVSTVASELARSSYLSTHMTDRDTEALKRVVKRSARAVRCDRNILELPSYMRIKQADDADSFSQRVSGRSRRENIFRSVTRAKTHDPLQEVVAKVRRQSHKKSNKNNKS
jgi:ATP-dependent RNA helicase DDX56/DBP9